MGLRERITDRAVGLQGDSFSRRARLRRFEMLVRRFPALSEMRVLDLGGEPHSWRDAATRPREVVLLNLDWQVARSDYEIGGDAAWMSVVAGDACDPPASLQEQRFDLVFSNSVIEHVGGHERRVRFSEWSRRLGRHYWIQTPSRYFPIEPHWLFPGFQFLSTDAQARVIQHWPIGADAGRTWNRDQARELARGVQLVTPAQMREYFPDGILLRERLAGLTKSIVAVR